MPQAFSGTTRHYFCYIKHMSSFLVVTEGFLTHNRNLKETKGLIQFH